MERGNERNGAKKNLFLRERDSGDYGNTTDTGKDKQGEVARSFIHVFANTTCEGRPTSMLN